jgi:hypothetical protein
VLAPPIRLGHSYMVRRRPRLRAKAKKAITAALELGGHRRELDPGVGRLREAPLGAASLDVTPLVAIQAAAAFGQ